MTDNQIFIIERKGNTLEDESIYNEGQFVRIKLIEYENKIYWIKKINGRVINFKEVCSIGTEINMDRH